jgi:hypothetical protein
MMEIDEERYPPEMVANHAVMEAYRALGCPCPDCHALFGKLAGQWQIEANTCLDRGMPRVKSFGQAEARALFGGRYLCVELFHESPSLMYKAHCLYAYDRFADEYAATWATNMNTALTQSRGHWDPEARTLRLEGEFPHPISGEKLPMRIELVVPEGFEERVDSFEWVLSFADLETDRMTEEVRLSLTRAGAAGDASGRGPQAQAEESAQREPETAGAA